MPYTSSKCYGHELGLSVAFRQWRATSHCRFIHGYALKIRLDFSCKQLDENGWVMDFGDLKQLRQCLQERFDHKLLVAQDDPQLDYLGGMSGLGIAEVVVVPAVGIEAFANQILWMAHSLLNRQTRGRVNVDKVEVWEHGGNSASYIWEE